MKDNEWLAERFEEQRDRLRAVAYRMLGSLTEADDAVQETWIRLSRTDTGAIDDLRAWLTTVVGRVCLNMLRSRKTRREVSLESHIPDPIVSPARHPPIPPVPTLNADCTGTEEIDFADRSTSLHLVMVVVRVGREIRLVVNDPRITTT